MRSLVENALFLRADEGGWDEEKHSRDKFGMFSTGPADSFSSRHEAEHGPGREHKEFNSSAIRVQKAAKAYLATAGGDHRDIDEARKNLYKQRDTFQDKARFSVDETHSEKVSEYVRKVVAEHEARHEVERERQQSAAREALREQNANMSSWEKELAIARGRGGLGRSGV